MATVSLCMIVKNEEEVLARCLDSIQGAVEEIVIVDTGSDDRTKEIASRYTSRLYDFPWIDDFAAARNFAFSKGTQEYLFWLDADDVLTPESREAFLQLKETLDPAVQMVMMKYDVAFDAAGRPTFSYYRERLMRREAGFLWEGPVHEAIAPAGRILYSDIAVQHRKLHPGDPARNLRIFEKMKAEGKLREPRQQYYYARELLDNGRYTEALTGLEAFLDQGKGWIENNIGACRDLAACRRALNDRRGALCALLRSLEYGPPRAEVCCDIGGWFFEGGDFRTAIYWYEQALARPKEEGAAGFTLPDCYGYVPLMQLCVCHDRLGEREQAEQYNEMAGREKPNDPAVRYNRDYFQKTAGDRVDRENGENRVKGAGRA